MHICDSNGTMAIAAGSIIKHLVLTEDRLGGSQSARLDSINGLLSAFYTGKPHMSKTPGLRLADLSNPQRWGVLNGAVVKAANARHLHSLIVELCDAFYDDEDNEWHRCATRVAKGMSRFYTILYDEADVFLSEEQKGEVRRLVHRIGASWQVLRQLSRAENMMLWPVFPKVHYFQHLVDLSAVINPRKVQVYTSESHVGIICRIWHKSAAGRYRRMASKTVLAKRLLSLYLRCTG